MNDKDNERKTRKLLRMEEEFLKYLVEQETANEWDGIRRRER